jgi:hypothetical protein
VRASRPLVTIMLSAALVGSLSACPLIAGIDDSYSAGSGRTDGGTTPDVSHPDVTTRHDTGADVATKDAGREANARDTGVPPEVGPADAGFDALPVPDVLVVDASTCTDGSTCVPSAPSGWFGPVIVSIKSSTTGGATPTPLACSAPYATEVLRAFQAPVGGSAVCGCSCAALGCSVHVDTFTGGGCSGSCGSVDLDAGCTSTGCTDPVGAIATAQAACPAMPSTTIPDLAWSEAVSGCEPAIETTGCGGAQRCVPTPLPGFSSKLCIFRYGTSTCPMEGYNQGEVFYASANDTRGCTACTCSTTDQTSCSGSTVGFWTGGMCAGDAAAEVPIAGGCKEFTLSGSSQVALLPSPLPDGSTCNPSTPTAMGTVNASHPVTLCCQM